MKTTKPISKTRKRVFRGGMDGANGNKTLSAKSPPRRIYRQPKTAAEQAIQRYIDLFEFAPIGFVTFDRVGRIEDINFVALHLLGRMRRHLISTPFALCIAKEDRQLFLHHLLKCRSSTGPVVTELNLRRTDDEKIPVLLSSTATFALMKDGARLYQTSIFDLTERKRAEEAIRQSEERYRTLFNLGPMAVYTIDTSGVIQNFNPQAAELWGREPALGDTDERFCGSFKMFWPDGSFMPHDQCPMAEVASGKVSAVHDGEVLIERPDGSRVTVLVNIRPLKNDRGEVAGAINCFYDITERKRAEVATMRLTALVRSSHDAVVAKDLNGIITDWNESAQRIFGYKPKEIIGKSILTLIPRDLHSEESEILRRIHSGESIDHYETIRRRKDGRMIDVSLTISPIRDLKGKVIGASKIARDITEHKLAERQLAEQARLLDLSNDAILIRDWRDRIVYWNRGAHELYGYSPEEALGKVTHQLLRTTLPKSLADIRNKLERNGRWSGELVHRCKDGSNVVVMSRWSLDRDARGKPTSILETNTDITARKSAEVALQRSKEALEQVVGQRTKELRVANAGLKNEIERRKGLEGEILAVSDREQQRLGQELHDGLCQHLTAVAFMARSVAMRLKNHRVIDASDIDKIAQLVNSAATDTRELSRALHRFDVDAAGLVIALQDLVDREIWKIPCRLQVRPSFHIEDNVAAAHLYRIAREAVINANKHAQAREIVIKLERSKQGMVLRVIDDGVGFTDEPKLKQGLGYHIMNYRAQLIGGRLKIERPKKGGTCVSCYFPDGAIPAHKAPAKENGRKRRFPAKIRKALAALI